MLNKLLFSPDAGWYKPEEPDDGNFRGYTAIEELLIPALLKRGLTQPDIHMLFVQNPSEAFKGA